MMLVDLENTWGVAHPETPPVAEVVASTDDLAF